MNRIIIAGALIGVAAVVTAIAFIGNGASFQDLALNLGSEILGIALTVAVIDWLIERNKLREEAQRQAFSFLHDIDEIVWIWQGGRQEFNLDEMIALLDMVTDKDPLPRSTQGLLANLGIRASDTTRLNPRLLKVHRRLKQAMDFLSGMAQIREMGSLATNSYVVDSLESAITALAEITGQQIHRGQFGVAKRLRDPSVEAQERRYLGSGKAGAAVDLGDGMLNVESKQFQVQQSSTRE